MTTDWWLAGAELDNLAGIVLRWFLFPPVILPAPPRATLSPLCKETKYEISTLMIS